MSARVPPGAARQLRVTLQILDPRWLVNRHSQFVVFAQGRSGSTLLGELLGAHPRVVYEGEILHHRVRFPRLWVHGRRARHPHHCYGFQVKSYQLRDDQGVHDAGRWLQTMHRAGWQVVHLRRENVVRHALSTIVAFSTGVFHSRDGAPSGERVVVDPEELLRHTEERALEGRLEARALADVPHLLVRYETDLLRPSARQATADQVFRRLGLPPARVSVDLRRIGADRLEDKIANAGELRARFAATPWADLLERP